MGAARLETRQLRYFLAVAEHGSFTRAAAELLIAQPSLSQAIQRMERQLGFPLFHRVGGSVVLSDTGRELLEPCRRALRAVRAVEGLAVEAGTSRRGRLELAAMPSVSIEPGAALIADFVDAHPGVRVSVVGAWTEEEVARAVREGAAEVGLLSAGTEHRDRDLRYVALGQHDLVVLSPPGQELPGTGPLRPQDLAGCQFVTSHAGSVMRGLVETLLADQADCDVVCEVDHRSSILPLVATGVGHAVLPSAWAGLAGRLGLQVRPLVQGPVLQTSAVCRTGPLTPLAEDFVELASFHAQTEPAAHA